MLDYNAEDVVDVKLSVMLHIIDNRCHVTVMMMSLRQKKRDGKGFFKPAPFTQLYTMSTVLEKNNLGSWYGWEIEHIGTVNSGDVLQGAFEFHKTCKEGSVKVNHDKEETVEKTPF